MIDLLEQLADTNISGAAFLLAYGVTWLLCGFIWKKANPAIAALITLLQGMVALPVALLIITGIGAFADRPETRDLDPLVILVAMSQLLTLPLLMVMHRKKKYTLIPFIFSTAAAAHFLIYVWLYQTFVYLSLSLMVAIVAAFLYFRHSNEQDGHTSVRGASHICLASGIILLAHASFLIVSHGK